MNPAIYELFDLFAEMSDEEQARVLAYVRSLLDTPTLRLVSGGAPAED